jgi:hypothetical protein
MAERATSVDRRQVAVERLVDRGACAADALRDREPLDDTDAEQVAARLRVRGIAQLRPMQRWVAVWVPLRRVAHHRTITRAVQRQGDVCWHVANVATGADVDDGLRDLLSEAYRTV